MGGAAVASSANNGFLQSGSQSATFGESPTGHLKANGDASAFVDFWLYGHGSGSLMVSVPYTLQIQVAERRPTAGRFVPGRLRLSAAGSASLSLGPGVGFAGEQWFDSKVLAWLPTDPAVDGVITKTGTLTVWRNLVNPVVWFPISLEGIVRTEAVAAVPEPGEFELLGCGLVGAAWTSPSSRMVTIAPPARPRPPGRRPHRVSGIGQPPSCCRF